VTLERATTDPDVVTAAALQLTDKLDHDRPVRLLGVRVEMPRPDP
jgi:DNA polymerase IV